MEHMDQHSMPRPKPDLHRFSSVSRTIVRTRNSIRFAGRALLSGPGRPGFRCSENERRLSPLRTPTEVSGGRVGFGQLSIMEHKLYTRSDVPAAAPESRRRRPIRSLILGRAGDDWAVGAIAARPHLCRHTIRHRAIPKVSAGSPSEVGPG